MPNAVFFYRISRWLYTHHIPFLPKCIQFLIFVLYNSKIPPKVHIGKGTYFICKGVSTVLHDGCSIGENCRLGIHLTIVGQSPYKSVARVGNNVWIGPNVTLQGPVIIEDGVIIAPGSVVNMSIPKNAIVAGVPAKIIGFANELNYNIHNNECTKDGYKPFLYR